MGDYAGEVAPLSWLGLVAVNVAAASSAAELTVRTASLSASAAAAWTAAGTSSVTATASGPAAIKLKGWCSNAAASGEGNQRLRTVKKGVFMLMTLLVAVLLWLIGLEEARGR